MHIAAPDTATYLCHFSVPYIWELGEEENNARRERVRAMFSGDNPGTALAAWTPYENGGAVWVYTTEPDEAAAGRTANECVSRIREALGRAPEYGSVDVRYTLFDAKSLREDFKFLTTMARGESA